MNYKPEIIVLDLEFSGNSQTIASYLIPHDSGAVLIECGPGSTQKTLLRALRDQGYQLEDITHLLLTHIHLDHAGAAGWLARQGVPVYVHEIGAPHLLDPSRLLASAGRIYGDRMDELWGDFLPVPENKLTALVDRDEIQVGGLTFTALDTPGHAYHHMAYLLGETCFSGDVGGVRIPTAEVRHLRVPMPPPEFHLPKWRESIKRLISLPISRIAPTHFGLYEDVDWHLQEVLRELSAAEEWMVKTLPQGLEPEELRQEFIHWAEDRSLKRGVDPAKLELFEKANPSGMSADGIKRYWEKYGQGG